eukprot:Rhum_TRINITY_DN13792_c0_g1::Rhum_TRINITY_DN13792_c0_g1_i1::g.63371::m.63371
MRGWIGVAQSSNTAYSMAPTEKAAEKRRPRGLESYPDALVTVELRGDSDATAFDADEHVDFVDRSRRGTIFGDAGALSNSVSTDDGHVCIIVAHTRLRRTHSLSAEILPDTTSQN